MVINILIPTDRTRPTDRICLYINTACVRARARASQPASSRTIKVRAERWCARAYLALVSAISNTITLMRERSRPRRDKCRCHLVLLLLFVCCVPPRDAAAAVAVAAASLCAVYRKRRIGGRF